MKGKLKTPSPAFVIAVIALFVTLGGTAGAVVTQAVPLARRALVADNAKKLGGQTAAQVVARAATAAAARPGPASTAAGLVVTKTATAQIPAGGAQPFQVTCDPGQKVISGGFLADNAVIIAVANGPVSEAAWGIGLFNLDTAAAANVNLYAICIR